MICFGVDRLGPWWTKFFMENPTLIGASLFDVSVSMTIMCDLVELLCQAVMGHILVLECLLSGTRGRPRLRLVLPGFKWLRYSRTPVLEHLPST
jgi:hypothetical protein